MNVGSIEIKNNNINVSENIEIGELYNRLAELARKSCKNSYSPYSNFRVGCAVMCENNIYTGCNIENASYGASNCAERTAIFTAAANGERKIDIIAIAAENSDGKLCDVTPCGICRQVIAEFSHDETKILLLKANGELEVYSFDEIMPLRFTLR